MFQLVMYILFHTLTTFLINSYYQFIKQLLIRLINFVNFHATIFYLTGYQSIPDEIIIKIILAIPMIKPILLTLFILQVLSGQRTVRVNYLDQYLLNSPTTGKDITVKLNSVEGNDASVPINVQIRQIQDPASPLTSSQLLVQTCTFVSKTCTTTFTAPTLNSAYKYAIRLVESTTLHAVEAHVQYISSASNQVNIKLERQGKIFLTPLRTTNPGFRFLILNNGITFTTNFAISTSPAPTVSSYNFNLYSVGSSALTLVSTQAVTSGNSLSFTGLAVGAYYLSFDLTISSISATTKYPITLDFTFTEDQCAVGNYLDKINSLCVICSTVTNAAATQTKVGLCECATGFYWNPQTSTCNACLNTDCSTNHNGQKNQNQSKSLICPVGNYVDRVNNVCVSCSTVTNAAVSQTKAGSCDCTTGFSWRSQNSTCSTSQSNSNNNRQNGENQSLRNGPQKSQQNGGGAIVISNNNNNKVNLRH